MSMLLLMARARTNHGSAPVSHYDAVVAATTPRLRWKLDETTGTTAADSSAAADLPGTISSALSKTFASTGVSVAAPAGFSALGRGVDFDVLTNSGASLGYIAESVPSGFFGGSSTSSWAIGLWVAGASGSQYLASRVNNAAVIYQFVTDTVEFFSLGYSGSDPRTGSQISLPASDTTTPHLIVYRYDNGQWTGFKDGAKVFDVARSFDLPASTTFYINSESAGKGTARHFDDMVWMRAPTDTEIANIWAARNSP